VFTRIFEPNAYGDYLLGLAFATLFATLLATPLKFLILREQSRGDGTDVSQTILAHRGKRLQTGGLESRFKAGITRVFEIL
jgi:hypothetical protein